MRPAIYPFGDMEKGDRIKIGGVGDSVARAAWQYGKTNNMRFISRKISYYLGWDTPVYEIERVA